MKEITIHKKGYHLNDDEFEVMESESKEFSPMVIRKDVSVCDREIGLLKKLSSTLSLNELFCVKVRFGGYIPLNLLNVFSVININCDKTFVQSVNANLDKYDTQRKIRVMRYNNSRSIEYELSVENEIGIIITSEEERFDNMNKVLYYNKFLYVSSLIWTEFNNRFKQWLVSEGDSVRLVYDNLINLLIMVKDAGDDFREILSANKPYIDRWTILDTGSTDNTISIIRDVFSNMEGNLYQEPFINFRESRNRLLELAGDECAFNLMLDDSYVLNGNLRAFLDMARGDDKADSFSLFIVDQEIEYSSNRITKPERKLKYKYKIHEIIEENENLCIPRDIAWIKDNVTPYMTTRTNNRKQGDIELLEEELRENPDDPRNLYYMAETYYFIKDWQNAFKYYKLRVESNKKGFDEEIYDSLFKMAIISERHFETSWEKVEEMYLTCFEADKTGPTPLFMIGYHYLLNGNNRLAYEYFKRVMYLPKTHKNMNTRPIITREYAPRFLLLLCFDFEDYELGFICVEILLQTFKGDFHLKKWKQIFTLLLILKQEKNSIPEAESDLPKLKSRKKMICFVDNSGWGNWDGETLKTKGIGGSETWTIEYAETLALKDTNEVIVFCKCDDIKVYNNVTYIPIKNFIKFALSHVIDVCLVSRFSEYLFLCNSSLFTISKLYFVLHDVSIPGDMIPISDKLSGVLCISEWQKEQFLSIFPTLKDKTNVISYGIETSSYQVDSKENNNYSFIYPSFPNRGLLYLLRMFPKIVERYPNAKLNVFCDFELDVLKLMKEEMDEIKSLIQSQSANVVNHGWVNRETLNRYWSEADIWFYPCIFPETCCRVAMEAAASKTFAICNDLAGLNETVGKRGAIIPGDPTTEEWQKTALTNLFFVLDNKLETIFIERNYEWVKTKSYSNVVNDFENRFLTFEESEEETKEVDIETKLRNIQSALQLDFGSFDEEYNEQLMTCQFINGTENVLEICGNIGRNSLIIGSILNKNNNTNFVSMECNLSIAEQLEQNRNKNNLQFSIEKCALSKRNLIQKPNESQTYVSNVVIEGYNRVKTITWSNLCSKYQFTFDTLILDCKGAFYYMVKDMPEMLTNINKIIMKNDYSEILHKNYIDSKLKENGFVLVYSKPADESVNMPCKNFFYQVWIKG